MANDEKSSDQSPGSGDVFSLDDIDKLLEEDNPEFAASLKEIKSDEEMEGAEIESLDVDGIGKDEPEDDKKEDAEEKPSFFKKIKLKVKEKVSAFFANINQRRIRVQNTVIIGFRDFVVYMRTGFPERVKYYKGRITEKIKALIAFVKKFKELNIKQKIVVLCLIPVGIVVLVLIQKSITGGWLPHYVDPLMPSFHKVADEVFKYDPKVGTQDFYQAFPQNEFTVKLEKVVVNLRRHSRSGPNPMGTFEFFIAADAQETAIEVKDRQREFLDQIQRSLESFSYEEASTVVGKRRMKEEVRKTLNKFLNQGRVRSVYYNTFIIKP